MPRALLAAFVLLAAAFCVLAAGEALSALWAGMTTQDLSESDAWDLMVLAIVGGLLMNVDAPLLLAGGGILVVLALTRRLDAAHERAVLVSLGLAGAAVLVEFGAFLLWASSGIEWGSYETFRTLPLLLVPVVLVWPHQPARALVALGAGLNVVRVLLSEWAPNAFLRAMEHNGAGVPVPIHVVGLMVLPALIGALGFACWARAFAGVARRHWPTEDAERARRRRWPLN